MKEHSVFPLAEIRDSHLLPQVPEGSMTLIFGRR